MNDAELMAAASLVMAACVEAMGENELRKRNDQAPAFKDGSYVGGDWAKKIEDELKRRETGASRRTQELFQEEF